MSISADDWPKILEHMRKELEPKEVEKRRLLHWIEAKKRTREMLDREIAKLEQEYADVDST